MKRHKKQRRQPLVQRYLGEIVCYGGEFITRAKMLHDLWKMARATGHPQPRVLVERYLQGQYEKERQREQRLTRLQQEALGKQKQLLRVVFDDYFAATGYVVETESGPARIVGGGEEMLLESIEPDDWSDAQYPALLDSGEIVRVDGPAYHAGEPAVYPDWWAAVRPREVA